MSRLLLEPDSVKDETLILMLETHHDVNEMKTHALNNLDEEDVHERHKRVQQKVQVDNGGWGLSIHGWQNAQSQRIRLGIRPDKGETTPKASAAVQGS